MLFRTALAWLLITAASSLALAAGEMSALEQREVTAFVRAAQVGDLVAVRKALDAGMPVDATLPPKDPRYPYTVQTALESAAVYARTEVVRLLLARGATLRRDARNGIYAASMHSGDSPELLDILVEHAGPDADLDAAFGPALVRAAANGARGEVDYLLGIGVDPDWRSRVEPWDEPALVRAGSHFEIVDALLAAGADPTGGRLPERWSLLFPAAMAGDAARTRRFLELGIDPQLRGPRGNALSIAACRSPRTARPSRETMQDTQAVVDLLLAAGVDPDVPSDGRTPLRCAEDSHDKTLAGALELAGAHSRETPGSRLTRGAKKAVVTLVLLLGGQL